MPVSAGEYVTHIEVDKTFHWFSGNFEVDIVMFEGHVIALCEIFARVVGNDSILAKKKTLIFDDSSALWLPSQYN